MGLYNFQQADDGRLDAVSADGSMFLSLTSCSQPKDTLLRLLRYCAEEQDTISAYLPYEGGTFIAVLRSGAVIRR
jgi:hypothetical protein